MSLLAPFLLTAMTQAQPYFVPQPVSWNPGRGSFTLNSRTTIVADGTLEPLADRLRSYLRPATGLPFKSVDRASANSIHLRIDSRLSRLGREGYRLNVARDGVEIVSSNPAGVFYGIQSLRQMLPPQVFRRGKVEGVNWTIPQGQVEDFPRFAWRGGHLDVGRHFYPKEFLLKFIDLLALHKYNTFHLHLTEDQGWRIEIKKYPRLTQVGGWRGNTMLTYDPPTFSGKPHSGFYTQDDLREVVAYAAERFINVVPEIEMPGHSQAAIAAYPELGNSPTKQHPVATEWGVNKVVFNVEDRTIAFLQDVLEEVMDIFPSPFIHIGGDECPKDEWRASPAAQAKMKSLGLMDENELQSWFIKQMDTFLTKRGRRLIGWDEILEGGLAPGATVLSWRSEQGGIAAANAGHDVVMAPNDFTYFDHYQGPKEKEPHAIGGFTDIKEAYSYEPVPKELTGNAVRHILGSQFHLWSEYFPHTRHVEYMAFPRACAFSEVLWSPKEMRNYDSLMSRLPFHLDRLTALDVNFRKLDPGVGGRS